MKFRFNKAKFPAETGCTLDSLRPGQEAVISGYAPEADEEIRLLEMGLIVGSVVRFVKRAPFGDPIQIRVRGFDLSLRRNLARTILAEPNSPRA